MKNDQNQNVEHLVEKFWTETRKEFTEKFQQIKITEQQTKEDKLKEEQEEAAQRERARKILTQFILYGPDGVEGNNRKSGSFRFEKEMMFEIVKILNAQDLEQADAGALRLFAGKTEEEQKKIIDWLAETWLESVADHPMTLESGRIGRYTGTVWHGVPEGYGCFCEEDGTKTEGLWENGWPKSTRMTFPDGSYRTSLDADGKWLRKTCLLDGTIYVGELNDQGEQDGDGTLVLPNGMRYEGQWKSDKMQGEGCLITADGFRYQGHWKEGKRSGEGTMQGPNGAYYKGHWSNDQRSAYGIMAYPEGERYEGCWENGERCGRGTCTFADGCRYCGEWKMGRPNGNGIMTYADGGTYDGEWKDGKPDGYGTRVYADGSSYSGEWKEDKRSGHGVMKEPEIIYEGEWKEDEMHGQGTFTSIDGQQYKGEWANGLPNGQGTFTWPDGRSYTGTVFMQNDTISGHGKMSWSDGKTQDWELRMEDFESKEDSN